MTSRCPWCNFLETRRAEEEMIGGVIRDAIMRAAGGGGRGGIQKKIVRRKGRKRQKLLSNHGEVRILAGRKRWGQARGSRA